MSRGSSIFNEQVDLAVLWDLLSEGAHLKSLLSHWLSWLSSVLPDKCWYSTL